MMVLLALAAYTNTRDQPARRIASRAPVRTVQQVLRDALSVTQTAKPCGSSAIPRIFRSSRDAFLLSLLWLLLLAPRTALLELMSTHPDFPQQVWEKTASKDDLRALFLHSTHSPAGPFPTQEDALRAVEELKGAAWAEAVDFNKAVTILSRFVEREWESLVPALWEQFVRGCEGGARALRKYHTFGSVTASILLGLPGNGPHVLSEYRITEAGRQAYARPQQSASVFFQHAEWDALAERWGFPNRPWTQKRLLMLSDSSCEAFCQLAAYVTRLGPVQSIKELPTLDQLLAYAEISARYSRLLQHLSSIVELYQHHQRASAYASRWASKTASALPFVDFARIPAAASTEALSRIDAFVSSIDANAPPFPSDLPSATALFGTDVLLQADMHRAAHQGAFHRTRGAPGSLPPDLAQDGKADWDDQGCLGGEAGGGDVLREGRRVYCDWLDLRNFASLPSPLRTARSSSPERFSDVCRDVWSKRTQSRAFRFLRLSSSQRPRRWLLSLRSGRGGGEAALPFFLFTRPLSSILEQLPNDTMNPTDQTYGSTTTGAGGYGVSQTGMGGTTGMTGTGAGYSDERGLGSGVGAGQGAGYGTTTGRDPMSHQAGEAAKHPLTAAAHPTHPVASAEAKDVQKHGHTGHHGTGVAGAGTTTTTGGTTGQEAGSMAHHPLTAAAHPTHPGASAEAKDIRKQGETGLAHVTTATGTHGTHGTHSHGTHGAAGTAGTTGAAKPSMGDKLAGATEKLVGKVTNNPAKVQEGEIRQTEGKAAASGAGVGGAAY
uniref:BY PROTMAP: gi/342320289/gb/EGU12230.1/ putative DHN family protein [Rhodotorula glutinis ATCC 204091] n=1 Tax=Rhodotorula toruloides TaxID=5286 RepID=A0A0K3CR31_RHOTO